MSCSDNGEGIELGKLQDEGVWNDVIGCELANVPTSPAAMMDMDARPTWLESITSRSTTMHNALLGVSCRCEDLPDPDFDDAVRHDELTGSQPWSRN